jgi:dienelactone hydrolase
MMKAARSMIGGVLLLGSITSVMAQPPAPTPAPDPAAMERMARERAAADAMPDSRGTGPYPAIKTTDAGLPDHVLYRPERIEALGTRKLAVLVWGNGGCSADGASARHHLAEIASHGYLVIAPGTIRTGPGAPPRPAPQMPPRPGPLGMETSTAQVAAGIDWALAENKRAGSPDFGKIDPQLVAVSGHSCGGLQALQIAPDPRIHAVVIHNSGVFKDESSPITGMKIAKAQLKELHTPVIYILGGPTDIAFENGSDDYDRIDTVPAALVSGPVGHGGTFGQANGGRAAQVAVAWLEWQLRGDRTAAKMFVGKDCSLCTDGQWTIRKKKID